MPSEFSYLGPRPKFAECFTRLNVRRNGWLSRIGRNQYRLTTQPSKEPSALSVGGDGLTVVTLTGDHDRLRLISGDRSPNPLDARKVFRFLGDGEIEEVIRRTFCFQKFQWKNRWDLSQKHNAVRLFLQLSE